MVEPMKTWRKQGGSAFPVVNEEDYQCSGMSLRDYFAGQALVGLIQSYHADKPGAITISTLSYQYADAMLKEREK